MAQPLAVEIGLKAGKRAVRSATKRNNLQAYKMGEFIDSSTTSKNILINKVLRSEDVHLMNSLNPSPVGTTMSPLSSGAIPKTPNIRLNSSNMESKKNIVKGLLSSYNPAGTTGMIPISPGAIANTRRLEMVRVNPSNGRAGASSIVGPNLPSFPIEANVLRGNARGPSRTPSSTPTPKSTPVTPYEEAMVEEVIEKTSNKATAGSTVSSEVAAGIPGYQNMMGGGATLLTAGAGGLIGGATSYATGGDFFQGAAAGSVIGAGGVAAGMGIMNANRSFLAKHATGMNDFVSSMTTSQRRNAMFAGAGLSGMVFGGDRRSHKRGFNQSRGNTF